MTTLKIPVLIPDPFMVTLLAPAGEHMNQRMGLRLAEADHTQVFAWHEKACSSQNCMVKGCQEPPATGPQGWTCLIHDWRTPKRVSS